MHHKGAQDARRARQFAKLIREITVAAKQGLPDPAANARLRAAVATAFKQNMTKDAVDRAIKKASGAAAGDDYADVRYEGYGPFGVAVIVETLTDNRNRTASDVRSAFSKHGGALGETNSVSFMFSRLGVIGYKAGVATADAMLEAAIEAGADDVVSGEDGHEVTCAIATEFTRMSCVVTAAVPETTTETWESLELAVRIWSVEGNAKSLAREPSDDTDDVSASTMFFWPARTVC